MIVKLIILYIIIAVTNAVSFHDCGSKYSVVKQVDISGCNPGAPCTLKRGENSTIIIQFEAENEETAVTAVVHGILQGIPVPFDFPYPDACTYGGVKCPLSSGTHYVYTATLPIKKMYPQVHVKIQWELQNDNSEDIVCVQMPVQIK